MNLMNSGYRILRLTFKTKIGIYLCKLRLTSLGHMMGIDKMTTDQITNFDKGFRWFKILDNRPESKSEEYICCLI